MCSISSQALVDTAPKLAATGLYLQISGIGPMLGSGFWLLASERFDPHTQFVPSHPAETVNPLAGLSGTFSAPLTTPIPAPSSSGSTARA